MRICSRARCRPWPTSCLRGPVSTRPIPWRRAALHQGSDPGADALQCWSTSAFVMAYDDWGGWYDHVPPPRVDANGYGLRVPALLVSPYVREAYVDHTTLDFTSILKFIENNWGVAPLATRDAQANDIASALTFPNRRGLPSSCPWRAKPSHP